MKSKQPSWNRGMDVGPLAANVEATTTQLTALCVLIFLSLALSAAAQQEQFEVASLKPTKQLSGVRQGCHGVDSKIGPNERLSGVPLGRCVVSSGRLSHMIGFAYGVSMDMLRGGPDWVAAGNDRYDIEARAENPDAATERQLISMFQALLAERFKLKFHRESHDMEGFALLVGKTGLKMKESSPTEQKKLEVRAGVNGEIDAVKKAAGEADASRNASGGNGALVVLIAQNISLAELADALTPFAHGHILDETSLKGAYSFQLTWESGQNLSGPLQDQLGLRMEGRKVPVDYIVIDHAEKPTTN